MKIEIFPYELKFKDTFKTASSDFKTREGLILSASNSNFTAYGEAAPLPGFSKETLAEVHASCNQFAKQIPDFLNLNTEKDKSEYLKNHSINYPSVLFALDTLWCDWHARKQGIPLQNFIFNQYQEQIFCNAVISSSHKAAMYEQVICFVKKGFTSIKLKVGRSPDIELQLIKKIRDAYPEIHIRLDANRNWNKEFALEMLSELEPFDIEFCEEPTADLEDVKGCTTIPIAADESVRTVSQAASVIKKNLADVLILKPMLFGSLNSIFVTNEIAVNHNKEVVFTSSFESVVGRTMISVLAAGCGSRVYHHGLATGGFFRKDLDGEAKTDKPTYKMQNKPGLGIDLSIETLINRSGAKGV